VTQPRWLTRPQTNAEWDKYVLHQGPDRFPHVYWLAVHYPAERSR